MLNLNITPASSSDSPVSGVPLASRSEPDGSFESIINTAAGATPPRVAGRETTANPEPKDKQPRTVPRPGPASVMDSGAAPDLEEPVEELASEPENADSSSAVLIALLPPPPPLPPRPEPIGVGGGVEEAGQEVAPELQERADTPALDPLENFSSLISTESSPASDEPESMPVPRTDYAPRTQEAPRPESVRPMGIQPSSEEKLELERAPALDAPLAEIPRVLPEARTRPEPLKRPRSGPEAIAGTVGAKSAASLMMAETTNPLTGRAEQTLPGAVLEVSPQGPRASVPAREETLLPGWSTAGLGISGVAPDKGEAEGRPVTGLTAVERVEAHLEHAVTDFKRVGKETMTVVLRPDRGTEMELQLSLRPGGVDIEASFRRGDFGLLSAHWNQLQQSLSIQGVRLGTLQDMGSALQQGNHGHAGQDREPGANAGQRELAGPPDRAALKVGSRPAVRTGLGTGRALETWA